MNLRILALAVGVLALTGCASIVNGTQQSISVVAKSPESGDVTGAKCALSNTKGDWFVTTPGSVTVHRGYGVLTVKCDHPDYLGELEAKSTTKAMAFGNILFGGAIGVTVDIVNGSAYDYPQLISVPMQSRQSGSAHNVAPSAPPPMVPAVRAAAAAPAGPAAPAPSTTTSSRSPPDQPSGVARAAIQGGQDGFSAEKLAKSQSCSAQPTAVLTAKGPGYESYAVACSSGDSLAIRCEYGNCRVLQ